MRNEIEAIIFDLDGVITDTAEFHYLAWKEIGNNINIEIGREFNETLKGVSRIDSLEKILTYGNKQNTFTNEEKEKLTTKKNEYYIKLIQDITPKDILPGIKEFLNSIKDKNIKIGMASASENALMVSKLLKIESYFDYIIDSSRLTFSKPHPEIFLKVAKALKVNPTNCIGIEDSKAGITSIKAANMYAVGIGNPIILKSADIVLCNTDDLSLDYIINKCMNL